MTTIVPPSGPKNAKICLIGEAPGNREWESALRCKDQHPFCAKHHAFIGPSGKLLFKILKKFGISEGDCYRTNVIKDRVLLNPLDVLGKIDKKTRQFLPNEELINYRQDLLGELSKTSCNVYVPLGNTALWALTDQTGISLWRGSIIKSPFRGIKVIPTYHPAAALRQTELYDLLLIDFKRIAEESFSSQINLPKRSLITNPTLVQVKGFIFKIWSEGKPFSFDVETPGGVVNCISLSNDSSEAMSIPLVSKYWKREEFVEVWLSLKNLLENTYLIKIGHNVSYDIIALKTIGINVQPPYEDTMHKHHALDPAAHAHSLAHIASIYTREPYWKEWDIAPSETIRNLESYNALDSAVTKECSDKLDQMLGARKSFYVKHYGKLLPHLIEMYDNGLMVDHEVRKKLAEEIREEAAKLEKEIAEKLSLKSFNANSPTQCVEVVYEILKCKPKMKMRKRKEGNIKSLSVDEETLLLLYQEEPIDVLKMIRDCREKKKLLSFLSPSTKSALAKRRGNVIRTEYKPMTSTGRLSSSASVATRIGLNLQNQPKKVRSIFIPRPGFIFIELDLSQAEARVTAWDAENYDLMDYFEKGKTEIGVPKEKRQYDIHRYTAAIALDIDYWQVDDLARETNKRIRHGVNYGLEPKKQQAVLLKEMDLWVSLKECQLRHQKILQSDPTIEKRQERIRNEVLKTKMQITPFGRKIIYHEVINDPMVLFHFGERDYSETFRAAYAYIPQSTVADMVNLALIEVNEELHRQKIGRVAAQIHDALLLEVEDRFEAIYAATRFAKQMLERPVKIRGNELSIPADIKLGYDWTVKNSCETLEQLEEVYGKIRKGG